LSTSDEQLIAKYQSTRSLADLDELIERHLGRVRNLAYRVVLCTTTADDITQDVFIKVMRNAHTYRGQARFSTWLYRITINTAKEYLRKQSHVKKLLDSNQATNDRQNEQPDQSAMHAEMVTEIKQALAKLSVKLRTAIVLTAMEDLSMKEAAAIEGCSTATMHWRIHQARKQFKQLLHRYLKK